MVPTAVDRGALAWAIGLPVLRVALVAAASVAIWLLIGASVGWTAFPPTPLLAVVAMLPVNLVCLVLVRERVHREGGTLRALIGFRRDRFGRDVLWGLLWLAVLYLPFAGTIVGVMWALHGSVLFERFDTVFGGADTMPALDPVVLLVLAVVATITFVPLNAPVEELVYRGYAQRTLARRLPVAVAIAIPAVLFGLQHAFYAPTPDAVLVYLCAFVVWGVGSGIIVRVQGRLMPMVVAHFLVNLVFSAPALGLAIAAMNGAGA